VRRFPVLNCIAITALEQKQTLSSPTIIRKPIGSKIQIQKSASNLEIKLEFSVISLDLHLNFKLSDRNFDSSHIITYFWEYNFIY
jgi:hypothetical protein